MQPKAILVLYQPNYRLKNSKYLLSQGDNIVGCDDKCQVQVSNKYFTEQYVANFHLSPDFIYIESLCDNMVKLKSNLTLKDNSYKPIQKHSRYLIPLEEIFYIGPYKAILQVLEEEQLRRVNNVLNKSNFQTNQLLDNPPLYSPNHYQIPNNPNNTIQNNNHPQIQDTNSDRTQKLSSNADDVFEPTLVIQDNLAFGYQPTLVIDETYIHKVQQQPLNNYDNAKAQKLPLPIPKAITNNTHKQAEQKQKSSSHPNAQHISKTTSNRLSNNNHNYFPSIIKNPIKNNSQNYINPYSQSSQLSLFSNSKKPPNKFSQQILYETIKKQQRQYSSINSHQKSHSQNKSLQNQDNQQQDSQISMPQTVKDEEIFQNLQRQCRQSMGRIDHSRDVGSSDMLKPHKVVDDIHNDQQYLQMPPTIRQSQILRNNQNMEEEQMPPTINDQDAQNYSNEQIRGDEDEDDMPPTINEQHQPYHKSTNIHPNTKPIAGIYHYHTQKAINLPSRLSHASSHIMNEDDDDILNLFDNNKQLEIKSLLSHKDQDRQKQKKQLKQNKKISLENFQMNNFLNQKVLKHENSLISVTNSDYEKDTDNVVKCGNDVTKNNNTKTVSHNKQESDQPPQNNHLSEKQSPTQSHKPSNTPTPTQQRQQANTIAQSNNVQKSTSAPRKRLFKLSEQKDNPKLANITGFKPSPTDKLQLKKLGYQLVPDQRLHQYDVLIIGDTLTHATQKLLIAILTNKPIVSQHYLHSSQSDNSLQTYTPNNVIEGIKWPTLQTQRGNTTIFHATGTFYFTQSLKQLEQVFICGNGTVTKQLNKRKKINLIINCEVEKDKLLYTENKTCKNWKFYSHRLIKQAVLIGQIMWKKYTVDEMSF